jgi:hypothetical protein
MICVLCAIVPALAPAQQEAALILPVLTPFTTAAQAYQTSALAKQVESIAQFAMMVENAVQTVKNTYDQLQTAVRMEQLALKNLQSAANVRSFDDAMAFANRQLSLERSAQQAANRATVKIGGAAVSVLEIADVIEDPDSLQVSEDERRRIYQRLGISPANYAYVKTFQQMNRDALERSLGMVAAYQERKEKNAQERAELAAKLKSPGEEGASTNSLIKDIIAMLMRLSETQEDILAEQAAAGEQAARDAMARQSVPDKPRVSATYADGWGNPPVDVYVEEFDDPVP